MVLFPVCVVGMIALCMWVLTDRGDTAGERFATGFVGAFLGSIVGVVLIFVVGATVPYKSEVVDTQSLVMVQDTQGVHQGYCLTSGAIDSSYGSHTRYYYSYQVPGGYNPGSVDSQDGTTITIHQDAASGQCVLTHSHTVFAESWFQLLGVEDQSQTYMFSLSQGGYKPSDQLGN